MVDFVTASTAAAFTINDININTASIIRDSTLFDLKGTVTNTLDFTGLKIDGSKLGEDGTDSNHKLINLDVTSTAGTVTMKDWTITASEFY